MLAKLTAFWLTMAVTVVAVCSYFVALTVDGVFGKDGFGTIGNMVVLTAGFFGGIAVYERLGYYMHTLQTATLVGIGSALLTFITLALLKLILDKILH
ncbi:MAG: hypothetical protein ACRCT6_06755 [Notoacmeibacter sp.]